ncbi:MAG: hypothetical protein COC24_013135 [Alphaproteobacteria bacterium]|nr:hypothetical protein [Alphaproteobacteria bacterium]
MQGITLSKAVRQNLQSLQSTATMMSETQNRLATGKKVNSALDSPTNYFTASALESRAGDLSDLMDGVGNAVQTLEAADNGIQAIQTLVESAQATARRALQSEKGTITAASVESTKTQQVGGFFGGGDADTDVADMGAREKLTINVDGKETNINLTGKESMNEIAEKISEIDGLSASTEHTGRDRYNISITASEDIKTFEASGKGAETLGITGANTAVTAADSETRAGLEAEFNDLLIQIDELTKDAGFNGNNFLNGDELKVIFNETGSSSLTIEGTDTTSEGMGLSATSGNDFQFNDKIESVLKKLDSASATLDSTASKFGSNLSIVEARKDFTNNMVNTLESGAANLTLADTNEEGANLLALQVRQQLSTSSLGMAAQADQTVLQLL